MKKILVFASALAGVFLAGSCQRETHEPVATANTVTITVEAPGAINTKTIADGTNVNEVHYAVYKTNSGEDYAIDDSGAIDGPLAQGVVGMSNKVASIDFDLLQDQDYTVIFWAQVAKAGHYTLGDLRTITIEDDVVDGNDETRAAFFARYDFSTYEHKDHKVTLRRPFAQLNLLTTPESLTPVQEGQTTGYTIDVKQSEVKVMGLGKSFNTLNGIAPKADEEIVFEMAATPEEQGQETLVVNGKPYHYVSMNYFFVPEEEKLVDIKYAVVTDKGNITHEILAVPTKENYRTNVIGNLLTKEATFEIVVDAEFDGDKFSYVVPDGVTAVTDAEELKNAMLTSGTLWLFEDIELDARLDIKAGVDVVLDMKGKKITADENSNADYVFIIRDDASLVITGNGVVEASPEKVMFYPAGDLVIENGTFIKNVPDGYTGEFGNMFVGTKPAGGWNAAAVTINGGYFDGGYYDAAAVELEDILAGTKSLVETADDIKKRGVAGDKNKTRVAIKELVTTSLNRSNNNFKIYGGTFVGVNPAWGDEGCMLPTKPDYLRPGCIP